MSEQQTDEIEYDDLLVESKQERAEWFWIILGGFTGMGVSGAGVVFFNAPGGRLLTAAIMGYIACLLFKWRIGL